MSKDKKRKQEHGSCFVVLAIWAAIVVSLVEWIWPSVIPFTLFQFWKTDYSLWEAVKFSWIPFAWGTGMTALVAIFTRNSLDDNRNAEEYMAKGLAISVWAGVAEEICFRWLIFYWAIVALKVSNWLFFGWLGFGLPEWIYMHVLCPVANWCTLGYMHDVLFSNLGWVVGAAVISSNGKFREGHRYLGLVGYINSWFLGMFFFYLVFKFGLVAAIIVHFLYDLFIFEVGYVDRVIERAIRRVRERRASPEF